jgi:polyhydroxyalkanoate synthesis regulator phasin
MAKRNGSTIETLVTRDLPKQLRQARTRTEKLVNRTWKQALELLPAGPRKRVKTAAARVEKRATDLQKRGEWTLKNARKQGENLVSRVETRAVEAMKPIVRRLDIASHNDIERLSRRVAQLERRFSRKPKHAVAA